MSRPKNSLTDATIKAAKPQTKEYCLRERNGLALRVRPKGSKSFYYIFDLQHKRHKMLLGGYPEMSLREAREKHLEAMLLVKRGINPSTPAPPQPGVMTVGELIPEYLDKHAHKNKVKSAADEDKRTLNKYVLPEWKDRPITSITRPDSIALLEDYADDTPGMARGILKIARRMFSYAVEREYMLYNPFSNMTKALPQLRPNEGERTLSDDEIIKIWNLLNSPIAPGSPETRRALLMVLITGQRPGEVVGMHRREIHGNWWTIPPSRIKTRAIRKRPFSVYLSPLAQKIIGDSPDFIFSSDGGLNPITRQALSQLINEETLGGRHINVDGTIITTPARTPYFGMPRWVPYDLRRTAATGLSELGATDEVIDAIQNRYKQGTIKIYNRNKYRAEKEFWLTKWSGHLEMLIESAELSAIASEITEIEGKQLQPNKIIHFLSHRRVLEQRL